MTHLVVEKLPGRDPWYLTLDGRILAVFVSSETVELYNQSVTPPDRIISPTAEEFSTPVVTTEDTFDILGI